MGIYKGEDGKREGTRAEQCLRNQPSVESRGHPHLDVIYPLAFPFTQSWYLFVFLNINLFNCAGS